MSQVPGAAPASTFSRVTIALFAAASTVVGVIAVGFLALIGLWASAVDENGESLPFLLLFVVCSNLLIAAPGLIWTGFGLSWKSGRRGWQLAGIGLMADSVLLFLWLLIVATA